MQVGGETLEAALEVMKRFGVVVMCGSISQYNTPAAERHGVKNLVRGMPFQPC